MRDEEAGYSDCEIGRVNKIKAHLHIWQNWCEFKFEFWREFSEGFGTLIKFVFTAFNVPQGVRTVGRKTICQMTICQNYYCIYLFLSPKFLF